MLLEADAVVEGRLAGSSECVLLRSLVPGSLFGEMGAIDAETKFDEAMRARLTVLMKLERQLSTRGSNDSRPPRPRQA